MTLWKLLQKLLVWRELSALSSLPTMKNPGYHYLIINVKTTNVKLT